MKFINVIKEGDFVKLKSIDQLVSEGWKREEFCPIIRGESFTMLNDNLIIDPNTVKELGNVVRIDHISKGEFNNVLYYACCNSIEYYYEDGSSVNIHPKLIDQVLIHDKWYFSNDNINDLHYAL